MARSKNITIELKDTRERICQLEEELKTNNYKNRRPYDCGSNLSVVDRKRNGIIFESVQTIPESIEENCTNIHSHTADFDSSYSITSAAAYGPASSIDDECQNIPKLNNQKCKL